MPNAYLISQRGVNALKDLLRGRPAATAPGFAPATVSPDEYAPPFTVRWAQSENDREGSWVIWLPIFIGTPGANSRLLIVGNDYVDFLAGTAALPAADNLPAGWRKLPNLATGGDVYMNIVRPLSLAPTSSILAWLDSAPIDPSQREESESDYHFYSILVAQMTTNATTGAKHVRQHVDSAITIPDFGSRHPGGSDGDEPGEPGPQPFDIEQGIVVRCFAPAPCGTMITGTPYVINAALGDILVHIDRDTQGVYTLSVDQIPRNETPTHCQWILYKFVSGEVTCDCRPRVLPVLRYDNKSTEIDSTNHRLQIKGWDTGTPAAQTTLVDELAASQSDKLLIVRNSDGSLEYMPPGHYAGGSLPTGSVNVVTGVTYGYYDDGTGYDYRIRVATAPLSVNQQTGALEFGAATFSYINTIPLSSIINT